MWAGDICKQVLSKHVEHVGFSAPDLSVALMVVFGLL